jgi:hypothetical protein
MRQELHLEVCHLAQASMCCAQDGHERDVSNLLASVLESISVWLDERKDTQYRLRIAMTVIEIVHGEMTWLV